mmetsp:Transcript_47653/g.94525  ORF Transcript_47653/g.94525 Transcript_47653/m.94525 type:complete len:171 (+) Transcript_47653:314-826(+)
MLLTSGPRNPTARAKALFWVAWAVAWGAIDRFRLVEGLVAEDQVPTVLKAVLACLLSIPAVMKDPVMVTVLVGSVGLNVAHLATRPHDQTMARVFYFWGMSYVAMALQGAAHDVSSQKATLLNLQTAADTGGSQKIRFEWSHVTFFPNLLFHSCHQSLTAKINSQTTKSD